MRAGMLAVAAILFLAPPVSSAGSSIQKRISTVEKQLDQLQQAHQSLLKSAPGSPVDVRGRRKIDDIGQWAYTPELEPRVNALLSEARGADAHKADAALAEAGKAVAAASAKAMDIARYWNEVVPSTWQARWRKFASANGLSPEIPDPQLLVAEKALIDHLQAGDFVQAVAANRTMEKGLQAAIQRAGAEIARTRTPDQLKFIARQTPCPGDQDTAAKASITRAASPVDFYPPASRRANEEGDVVLIAHVAATSCATQFAILTSSGNPRLDEAALKVAEASRYAAATEDGQPIEGYVTFKVRFTLR